MLHRNAVLSRAIVAVAILVGSKVSLGQNTPLTPQPGLSAQSTCASSALFGVQPFVGPWPGRPPDSEIAVGQCHVLLASNLGIRAYDKLGQAGSLAKPLFTTPACPPGPAGFWLPLAGCEEVVDYFVGDPKLLWDPLTSRWWASAHEVDNLLSQPGVYNRHYLAIAVSKGSDPNAQDGWWFYRVDMTAVLPNPVAVLRVDLPTLAFDASAVCVAAWDFTMSRWYAVVLDKQALLSGTAPSVIPIAAQGDPRLSPFVPEPYGALASKLGPMDGTPFYLIASTAQTEIPDGLIRLNAIRQDQTPPTWTQAALTVAPYRSTDPAGAPQPSPTTITIETQRNALFFWAVYRNGHLWAAHGVRNPNAPDPNRAVVRWYQIAMNGWPIAPQYPSLVLWGELDVPAGIHAYNPSISVDSLNNAAITFDVSGAGPGQYLSTWRAVKCASDASFQTPEPLHSGFASFTHELRFDADYTGTDFDPTAASVFYGHSAIRSPSPTNEWQSWAHRYVVTCGLDVNGDGATDTGDMTAFAALWQQGRPEADYHADGIVSTEDLTAFYVDVHGW